MLCSGYNIVSSFVVSDGSGTDEPVSIQDCKDYMRMEGWTESDATDFVFDDVLIAELITSARQYIEELGSVSLIPHEVEAVLTNYDRIELPFSPIDEVTSIVDRNGDTVDDDNVRTVGNERKYIITPTGNDLVVTYTTTALNDLRPLVDIKRIVAALYENRGMDIAEVVSQISLLLPSYSRKSAIV